MLELLFVQEQEQQAEENYVHECESHGTGCCPIFAGTCEISGASIVSELQSHGSIKAQVLTSSGCRPFLAGVGQIVQQGCFGEPVFIDGLAPRPVGFMYVMVPMENAVAREAVDVAATVAAAFSDKAGVGSAAVVADNVGAGAGAGYELPSMPRNVFRDVQGRLLPPPPDFLPPALPTLGAVVFANDPAVLSYGLSGQESQHEILVPSS